MNTQKHSKFKNIDFGITFIPFFLVSLICIFFAFFPNFSNIYLSNIRNFINDNFSIYYLCIGLGMFLLSLYMAFSKYGKIRLGNIDKPQFSYFKWGAMIFTSGLAADIIFYSLCEWILYANENHIKELANKGINSNLELIKWSSTYPLFHWGLIPWSFYLVLGVCFGFMIHNRNKHRQKYSEACRPILGKLVDKNVGRFIDILAVFALIAGTATTFSLATPLLSLALSKILGIANTTFLSILLIIIICIIYTSHAYLGIENVSKLATFCTYLFFGFLAYVFIFGKQEIFIIKYAFIAISNMLYNFFPMATYLSSKADGFTQNWTIFYWAYWIVWCVGTPFFIGSISKGRTIKQTILGAYAFGIAGTYVSFIVLGHYGLSLNFTNRLNLIDSYLKNKDLYTLIIGILDTLPSPKLVLLLLSLTMIAFYATSFDSLTLIAASYSCKKLKPDEEPNKKLKLFWAILLILLPIALLFSKNSMANLQTVSIIAAFPIGFIIILIIISFFKDANLYLKEK